MLTYIIFEKNNLKKWKMLMTKISTILWGGLRQRVIWYSSWLLTILLSNLCILTNILIIGTIVRILANILLIAKFKLLIY